MITMRLKDNYYQIAAIHMGNGQGTFHLLLNPDCDVYQGHFPGNPVCPGVFHIGMLKDCVRTLTGRKVFVSSIRQCRLTSVATPAACPELKLTVSLQPAAGGYDVVASLEDEERTYMEYRGRMSVEL